MVGLTVPLFSEKMLISTNAYMVSCPTRTKNLERTLSFQNVFPFQNGCFLFKRCFLFKKMFPFQNVVSFSKPFLVKKNPSVYPEFWSRFEPISLKKTPFLIRVHVSNAYFHYLDAYMVSCPTRTKNLERTLVFTI